MVFAVALIASNIFETKEIDAGPFCITGGLLFFPICYIIRSLKAREHALGEEPPITG